jgi:hypothetical protein
MTDELFVRFLGLLKVGHATQSQCYADSHFDAKPPGQVVSFESRVVAP